MINIGAASKIINNPLGTHIQGATVSQYAKSIRDNADPIFSHIHEDISIPVRLPGMEEVEKAKGILAQVDAGEKIPSWDMLFAHGLNLLHEQFSNNPIDTIPIHVVRIGDLL